MEISVALAVLFLFIGVGFLALFFILPEWMGISKTTETQSNHMTSHKRPQESQLTSAEAINLTGTNFQEKEFTKEKN